MSLLKGDTLTVTLLKSLTIYAAAAAAAATYSLSITIDIIGCHGDVLSFKVQNL